MKILCLFLAHLFVLYEISNSAHASVRQGIWDQDTAELTQYMRQNPDESKRFIENVLPKHPHLKSRINHHPFTSVPGKSDNEAFPLKNYEAAAALIRYNWNATGPNALVSKVDASFQMAKLLGFKGFYPVTPISLPYTASLENFRDEVLGHLREVEDLVGVNPKRPYQACLWQAVLYMDGYNKQIWGPGATGDLNEAWKCLTRAQDLKESHNLSKTVYLWQALLVSEKGLRPWEVPEGEDSETYHKDKTTELFNLYRNIRPAVDRLPAAQPQAPRPSDRVSAHVDYKGTNQAEEIEIRVRNALAAWQPDPAVAAADSPAPQNNNPGGDSDNDGGDNGQPALAGGADSPASQNGNTGGDSDNGDGPDGGNGDGNSGPGLQFSSSEEASFETNEGQDKSADSPSHPIALPSTAPEEDSNSAQGIAPDDAMNLDNLVPHSPAVPMDTAAAAADDSDDEGPVMRKRKKNINNVLQSSDDDEEEASQEHEGNEDEHGAGSSSYQGSKKKKRIFHDPEKMKLRTEAIIKLKGQGKTHADIIAALKGEYHINKQIVSSALAKVGLSKSKPESIPHKDEIISLYEKYSQEGRKDFYSTIAEEVGDVTKAQVGKVIRTYRAKNGMISGSRAKPGAETKEKRKKILELYLAQQKRGESVDIQKISDETGFTKSYVSRAVNEAVKTGELTTSLKRLNPEETALLKEFIQNNSSKANREIAKLFNETHYEGDNIVMEWRVKKLRAELNR